MTEILITVCTAIPLVISVLAVIIWKPAYVNKAINSGALLLSIAVLSSLSLLAFFYFDQINLTASLWQLLRFDTLSITMFLMVSIIGFIVLRFSKSYLQGDPNHLSFVRKLAVTIACVQILVLSGNLFTLFFAWVAASFSLQQLILFYKERKEAQRAVKKKFFVARLSDLFLLASTILIYLEFGSSNLETVFQGLKNLSVEQLSLNLELSAIFLALAAIIKSVQIPFHGWILDVMEAPTPVSALLHAGLLNAGPFLIIRFSYLMDLSSVAPILLLVIGGVSAIYGTIVFPAQPAIKTGLAYSSIGHMGFSLMISGMGLYSAALLHLVAHSFYKAHSFLSSGSAIDKYRLKQLKGPAQLKITFNQFVLGTFGTALTFFLVIYGLGKNHLEHFQMVVLGAIIITGVSAFMVNSTYTENGYQNIFKGIVASGFVLLAFFTFEGAIGKLMGGQVPAVSDPSILIKSISITLLAMFLGITFLSMLNASKGSIEPSKWQVYKRNGFYIHIIFDRFINPFNQK